MTNPNDPAFPGKEVGTLMNPPDCPGLTKREYFAAMTMPGIIASRSHPDVIAGSEVDFKRFAEFCLQHADALIAELSK